MAGKVLGTGCAVLSNCVQIAGGNEVKSGSEVLNPGHRQSVTFPEGGQAVRSWLGNTGDECCCDESSLRSVVASNQL